MPKIIENVRGLLIDEAQRQIEENGYDNVTIRSIARGCALGVGTFYNYFKSKDMLIATFLLEDWQERMSRVNAVSEGVSDPMTVIESIHNELAEFTKKHHSIFISREARKTFNSSVGEKHGMLRAQVAAPIYRACLAGGFENPEFLSEFAAEAVLNWTVEGKKLDELSAIISKLFIK